MDDLPVEQNCFVSPMIGRYQLAGLYERLGKARIYAGFMADPTAPILIGTTHSAGTQPSV
jgi:hypothetical protein